MTTSLRIRSNGSDFGEFERALGVIADHGFVPGEAEGAGKRGERVGFVVDDQDLCLCAHAAAFGSVMINVAPLPAWLSTAMVPP